jgi:hypothetical protein
MKKMRRLLVGTVLILFIPSLCFAQDNPERTPIKAFKKGLGYRYTYQTRPLRAWADFHSVIQVSPEAVTHLNHARINSGIATGLSLAGGVLIGWPIGQALGQGLFRIKDKEPTWVLAAVGGGLVIVSIGFGVGSSKQLKKAVDIYNQGIAAFDAPANDITLAVAPNGINIKIKL